MYPRLSIQKRLILIGFFIIGIAVGIIFVTPKVDGDIFLGGCIGFIGSLALSFIVFPELRKSFQGIWGGANRFGINMKIYFTHPTQIPLTLGALWFIIFMLVMTLGLLSSIFDKFQNPDKPYLLSVFLSPSFLLFGLSGFLMIKRNEGVDKFGQIYKGFWAYFNGVLGIIFGWGLLLLMLLAYAFKW